MTRRDYTVLGLLAGMSLVIKLLPLVRFGQFAFGYDSGFYRRYVMQPLLSVPNTPVPGLDHTVFIPRIILDCVRFLASPDVVLYGTFVAFSLIGVVAVWYVARYYFSKRIALYTVGLYVVSAVQFASYGNFFFKETIALPLFLAAILFFERERYALGALVGVLVILTQQTTSIVLMGVIGLGFVLQCVLRRSVSVPYMFAGATVVASYLYLHPHVAQKIASPPVGIFLTQSEYLLLSLPILALALVGARAFYKSVQKKPLVIAALAVPLVFALFHLPFYNRIYVFLSLFLMMPAAFGCERVVEFVRARVQARWRSAEVWVVCALFALVSIPLGIRMYTQQPVLEEAAQVALRDLGDLAKIPQNSSIITSPRLLPWVHGWSMAKVYVPGNLKEPHPLTEWRQYWLHADPAFDKGFLASFPQPLYVFAGDAEKEYRPSCARAVSQYLFSLESCR